MTTKVRNFRTNFKSQTQFFLSDLLVKINVLEHQAFELSQQSKTFKFSSFSALQDFIFAFNEPQSITDEYDALICLNQLVQLFDSYIQILPSFPYYPAQVMYHFFYNYSIQLKSLFNSLNSHLLMSN